MNYSDLLVQLPRQCWLKIRMRYDSLVRASSCLMVTRERMGEERKVEVSRGGCHQFSKNWVDLFGFPALFMLEQAFVHSGHKV